MGALRQIPGVPAYGRALEQKLQEVSMFATLPVALQVLSWAHQDPQAVLFLGSLCFFSFTGLIFTHQ